MYFKRIKDMREDHDLSQTDVAQILGIQQTVYSRYERGYQTIPLQHLIALADYYHVSLDYLVERSENLSIR
ncbi:MAG: helix-turn-helix transcriptional regulator [Clostridia bacterium]|nr:helix-turn-helix transcriptional regulator [Clostridia bacterium]